MPYTLSYGEKIHYETEGDGLPLVLQHGFFGSIEDWYEYGYVAELKHLYRLVLIDSRAHGESGKPHNIESYSPKIHADDSIQVLDDLNIRKCHHLGFSQGGRFGYFIARFHPERLLSLIVLGEHTDPIDIDEEIMDAIESMDDWVPKIPNITDKHKNRLLKNDRQALVAASGHPWPDDSQVLDSLDIPCLVLCGDRDECFETAKRAASENKKTDFIELDGLDHVDLIVQSDVIIPHIINFLSQFRKD